MTSLKIDKVNIEVSKGRIRLRWTYQGQRFSLSIGEENQHNLDFAKSKAYQINSDIYKGSFSYESYKPQPQIKIEVVKEITLIELWDLFLKMKLKSGLKATSIDCHKSTDRLIRKLGDRLSFNAFEVQENLEKITTIYRVKKAMQSLSACCNYGVERKLIKENNFKGVWKYLPDQKISNPYCFNDAEIKSILDNFSNSKYYNHLYDLIVFWLHTGCRPSEALGLKWSDISDDFSTITLRGSPQIIRGKGIVWSEGSKNFKKGGRKTNHRTFPINQVLQANLKDRYERITHSPNDLVFPNKSGNFLNYCNFCNKAWKKCVRSIKGLEKTTPYNLRDTFITRQLCKGIPIAVIASWCDNSPTMIERYYADYLKLATTSIKPVNF